MDEKYLQGHNGPGVLTRVTQKLCKTEQVYMMYQMESCNGFKVYSERYTSSIPFWEYEMFLQPHYLRTAMNKLNGAIIAHVWNKFTRGTPLDVNSDVAYIRLAKEYCPKVLASSQIF